MIKGLHITLFTPKAKAAGNFLRDKLGFSFSDVGGGYLIFDMPATDMGLHPADETRSELSFYCDDIYKTVSHLKKRGVKFVAEISDTDYGLSTRFLMANNMEVELFQPSYERNPSQ